ncbi:MAG: HIT family protein [Methanobacteriota archaeon]|nr:MAG: HIT family protein [Euryarchaeota archaeon]
MVHETLISFDHEKTMVKKYQYWTLLVRKKQITLGSLVMVINNDIKCFKDIPEQAFTEMKKVTQEIETNLGALIGYDKINYLALMMVDPQVHYHVIPRYEQPKNFGGRTFIDAGWPALPRFDQYEELEGDILQKLRDHLRKNWESI